MFLRGIIDLSPTGPWDGLVTLPVAFVLEFPVGGLLICMIEWCYAL